MITDIFAFRYLNTPIWSEYTETERRLLNQSFGIVKDALPYYTAAGKINKDNEAKWKRLHDKLARELGVTELSSRFYSYQQTNALGNTLPVSGFFSWDHVCEQFVNAKYTGQGNPDRFIKERVSFVELGLRLRGEEISTINADLPNTLQNAKLHDLVPRRGLRIPGSAFDNAKAYNSIANGTFEAQIDELNERLRRAGVPLSYHNGFIQLLRDEQIDGQIEKPFWAIVGDPIWKNVDIDMKEALDRRDSNSKDPALFAAKALESTIKIISDSKGWTRNTEKGAGHYIDNLMSKANGAFLTPWEGEMLKDYFHKVRNAIVHGPGPKPMPSMSTEQTEWAIEVAMSWVKSLVNRTKH